MAKSTLTASLVAGLLIGLSQTATAVPSDDLAIGSTSLSLSTTKLDFFSLDGDGSVDIGATSTGAYANLGGDIGSLQTLTFASPPPVSNFLTIPSLPQAQFTLTALSPGIFGAAGCGAAPAVGQTCTFPGSFSFLNLVNTSTGTIASFTAVGTVRDANNGTTSDFTATFTTEVVGQSFQQVLGNLFSGGTLNVPYSATVKIASGDLAGTLNLGQPSLSLSATDIAFSPTPVTIGPASSGAFATLAGASATVHNISISSPVPVPSFLTFPGHPELSFTLSAIAPGIFSSADCFLAPAVGQECAPLIAGFGSGLNFINTLEGSVMFFSAMGDAIDTATASNVPFDALFTTEFDLPFQFVLADLSTDEPLDASYSVEFEAAGIGTARIPEPSTLLLVGAAIAGLGAARRRKPRAGI